MSLIREHFILFSLTPIQRTNRPRALPPNGSSSRPKDSISLKKTVPIPLDLASSCLVVIALLWYWRRKISETIRKKPQKPWKIPEEQQHLAELKRTDKNAYEQERIMMQDEYKSALLWYKDDRKQLRTKPTKEKSIKTESSIFNKLKTSLKTEAKPQTETKRENKEKTICSFEKTRKKTKRKNNKTAHPNRRHY